MSAPKRKSLPKALRLDEQPRRRALSFYADALELVDELAAADAATRLPAGAFPTAEQEITWLTSRGLRVQAYEMIREALEAELDFVRLSAPEGSPHGDKS